jgi:hypothetical protein
MVEKEAYAVLNWPHIGRGNSGDEWLAFRCPTSGCPSEGVSRNRDHDFGRCGICGAIMEAVASASTHPQAKQKTSTTPPTAKPTKPAKGFDVPKETASAQKLAEQLEELVVKRGQCPDDERNILLMGYWSLIFDFHKAILSLIPNHLCGSAFALVRPCLEALVRAHVAVKGSTDDIKKLQDDTYVTDFDRIGSWIDKAFGTDDLFKNLLEKAQSALHSFTHAGLSQIGRRFDGHDLKASYDDGEIVEVIRVCTSAVWMVTNLVTIHLGFRPEANKAQALYLEWGKH